jgi:patatin-like phospholipase/acyl hydrolase
MEHTDLALRLSMPGPKRILALDGGGIRGLVTLGYLASIEKILRIRHRRPEMVLCDYFDLIGGTSTGTIIGTLLCLGWSVDRIRSMYLTLGREAFQPRKNWFGPLGRLLGAKFDEKPLEALLIKHLGHRTLGSSELQSGLVIIIKRIDTGSVWVMLNVPGHCYYEMNRSMPLWELVRSSTAAPTFFKPRLVEDVAPGENAIFVDGGVSMHGNPALQLLMVATLQGYALNWPLGEDKLLLCSVGTGGIPRFTEKNAVRKFTNLQWLANLITQLMQDASLHNQTILQWMSRSPTARFIDGQIGSLESDQLTNPALITYLRYNTILDRSELMELGLEYTESQVKKLKNMSEVRNISQLDRIGLAAGERQIREEHFPQTFDLTDEDR